MAKNKNNNNLGAAIDMFDFQNMMDNYYRSKPKDDAGKAAKRTFQSNMIQSAFDSQLAAAQAERAQEYDLDARRTTADLELSNQLQLMKKTDQYGRSMRDQEYELQNRFSTQEQKRELDLNVCWWRYSKKSNPIGR